MKWNKIETPPTDLKKEYLVAVDFGEGEYYYTATVLGKVLTTGSHRIDEFITHWTEIEPPKK